MIIVEKYEFQYKKYDDKGINIDNGDFFLDYLKRCEQDFHRKNSICYANHLFANHLIMNFLNNCLDLKEDEKCGMDLIEGRVDLDINLKIEEYSEIETIYALGSINEDEPLYLVVDNSLLNNMILLKYLPEDDTENIKEPINVNVDLIKR